MTVAFDAILWTISILIAIPLAVLAAECLFAVVSPRIRRAISDSASRPRCAILVPAHNEEAGISATLADLLPQLRNGDRILVIADNCSDATAAVARSAGAEAVERQHATERGKGYALAFGVTQLQRDPPDIVVIVDADCRLPAGTIDRLVRSTAASHRPVQAAYLLDPPADAGPRSRLSGLAFLFKNLIRPLGLHQAGVPCMLAGAGMAFPWRLLRDAPLASGNIVEDMRLGVDLAVAGHPPKFEPSATVRGELATGAGAEKTQRTRWEHGHLRTMGQVPRLFLAAVKNRQPSLIGLAMELAVPPLSILAMLWLLAFMVAGVWWLIGGTVGPVETLSIAAIGAVVGMLLAWARFGRAVAPLPVLLAAPWYAAAKIPIYFAFLFRPQRAWVRTPRSSESATPYAH